MSQYHLSTHGAVATWRGLSPFTRGYVTAAMCLLTDDDGKSLDNLGLSNIDPATLAAVDAECKAFRDTYHGDLELTGQDDDEQLGQDLFLTRNRHGAGFWDRGYDRQVAQRLTAAAHAEGSDDWYLGDDGQVYRA